MNRYRTVMAGVMVLLLSGVGLAHEGGGEPAGSTHRKVTGTVSKIQSGLTTVRTRWGRMTLSSAFAPDGLTVGEELELEVNEYNAVIDVHRKGEKGHAHRFVTGHLTATAPDRKEIRLQTPDDEKAFQVQAGRSQTFTGSASS